MQGWSLPETLLFQLSINGQVALTSDTTWKGNKRNRIAEVILRNGELRCLLDEKIDCVHIGFVYSIPEVYIVLNNKGMKAPKALH